LLRPKFGLRIFLDQISVARSSSDLSRVLDRIWVLALRLAGRLAELDLTHYLVVCAGRATGYGQRRLSVVSVVTSVKPLKHRLCQLLAIHRMS